MTCATAVAAMGVAAVEVFLPKMFSYPFACRGTADEGSNLAQRYALQEIHLSALAFF